MKKYRFGFEPWGLLLFLAVMLPNLIWFAVPAPNDILREGPTGGFVDSVSSVFQILMAAALCLLVNRERGPLRLTPLIFAAGGCVLLYYAGWVWYYTAFTGPPVIVLLALPPCLAFAFFTIDRKNFVALLAVSAFTLCHLTSAAVHFIL